MNATAWGRRHGAALALFAVLAAFYFPWTWSDQLASLGGDSAIYLLTARHFSWYAGDAPAVAQAAADSPFPPLYPLWLMLTGGAADLRFAHAATTVALLAAFAALYAWLTGIGLSRRAAAACVALFAALHGTLMQSLYLLSEAPYLALSLGALAALAPTPAAMTRRRYVAATVLVACSILTRTAGIALLPALVLALWRGRPRHAVSLAVAAVVPLAAWSLWHRPEQSYTVAMARHYAGTDAAGLLGHFQENALFLGYGLLKNWLQTTALLPVVIGLLALGALASLARLRRGEADAWYLWAYAALLLAWPFPAEAVRFTWLVVPLLLGSLLWGAAQLGARLSARAKAAPAALLALALAAIALVVVPGAALDGRRALAASGVDPAFRGLPEWYDADPRAALPAAAQHVGLARAIAALSAQAPADACIFSIKPSLVAFYASRRSVAPPVSALDDAAFAQALRDAQCRYALLLPIASPTFQAPYYPLDRLGPGAQVVAAQAVWAGPQGDVQAFLARLP